MYSRSKDNRISGLTRFRVNPAYERRGRALQHSTTSNLCTVYIDQRPGLVKPDGRWQPLWTRKSPSFHQTQAPYKSHNKVVDVYYKQTSWTNNLGCNPSWNLWSRCPFHWFVHGVTCNSSDSKVFPASWLVLFVWRGEESYRCGCQTFNNMKPCGFQS